MAISELSEITVVEAGEIPGRKLPPGTVVEIGLEDVEGDNLLPRRWTLTGEEAAAAIRDERDSLL